MTLLVKVKIQKPGNGKEMDSNLYIKILKKMHDNRTKKNSSQQIISLALAFKKTVLKEHNKCIMEERNLKDK